MYKYQVDIHINDIEGCDIIKVGYSLPTHIGIVLICTRYP